jgi:hypothetical protein
MSDGSDPLQVNAILLNSPVDITELSEPESLAIFPTEKEIYAATAAKLTVLIIHIELVFKFITLYLKDSMSRNF